MVWLRFCIHTKLVNELQKINSSEDNEYDQEPHSNSDMDIDQDIQHIISNTKQKKSAYIYWGSTKVQNIKIPSKCIIQESPHGLKAKSNISLSSISSTIILQTSIVALVQ